jgi:hypothetical protein
MLRDTIKEVAENLSAILNHPLHIPGTEEHVSLFGAVENFDPAQPEHSNLSKVLRIYARNPHLAEALIEEISLLSKDLAH